MKEKEREYKMSDVVYPSTSRTIRRIPISRKQLEEDEDEKVVEEYVRPRRKTAEKPVHHHKKSSTFTKIAIVFVLIISMAAIAAALSLAYAKGTVTITPKKIENTLNTSFTAVQGSYSTITASEIAVETVASKPGTFVQSKAKGSVIITNTSSQEQELVIQTRLDNNGKIYRLTKPVLIPAGKKVSAPVIADGAGESWNLNKSEAGKLKIPGFKGSKKYDQFYAELETDITGGFSGTKSVIDDQVYKETRDRLVSTATDLAKSKLKAQVGEGYSYFDTLVVVDAVDMPQVSKGNNQSQIGVKANALAYIFDTKDLIKKLNPVDNFHPESIDHVILNPKNPLKYSTTASLTLNVLGTLTVVGNVPMDTIKADLSGVKISDINNILKKYEGISKASIKVAPFWKKTFPTSSDRIIINIAP